MPIKIEKADRIPVQRSYVAPLFKDKKTSHNYPNVNGKNIFKNYKINPLTKLTLVAVDKLSPMLNKHRKVSKLVFLSCEKLITLSEKVFTKW